MPVIETDEIDELLEDRRTSGKMFLKKAENRQEIELPTGYTTTIEDEFNGMKELYSASPQNAVRPYTLIEEPRGYVMEYFPGEPLKPENIENPERIAGQLQQLGQDILEEDTPHGDIRRRNILIMNGEIKLIDAAGIMPGLEGTGPAPLYQQAVSWDATDINNLIQELSENSDFSSEEYVVAQPAMEF